MHRIGRFLEDFAGPEDLLRLAFDREPKPAFDHLTQHETWMTMRR